MFGGVQVEHELAERAFQPRDLAGQHREARSREFCGALEIHLTESFADLEMLLRPIPFVALANPTDLDIVVLIGSERHVIERYVGEDRQHVPEGSVQIALTRLAFLDEGLYVGHLGLQRFGLGRVAGAHRVADLLRGGIATFLLFLKFRQMQSSGLVGGNDPVDLG